MKKYFDFFDFDAQITQRGEFMQASDLNRYFFDGLQQLLGLSTTTYSSGYKIWAYELPWSERNVTRPGSSAKAFCPACSPCPATWSAMWSARTWAR